MGAWKEFHVTAPIDQTPVASASDVIATHGQDIAASILFSVSDADHDTITAYQVWDSTSDPASGHWVVGGVAQAAGIAIDVSPAQLTSTSFQSGSGSDDLWVRANRRHHMGAWKEFHVTAPIDQDLVASASDVIATHGQDIAASILFSVSDADHDTITAYQVWDSTSDPASGHRVVGGVAQAAGIAIDVSPAQLTSTSFQSGSGSDDLWVRANDGITWGAWKGFHVTAPIDQTPVASASDVIATHGQEIAASILFSVSDADHDTITTYQVWDSTSDPASGHWVVGGVAQAAGIAIDVSPAQLTSTSFQSGSGSDDLWVRANDGFTWGAWKEFHVTAPIDQTPVASASDVIATHGQDIAASILFSVSDADHDTITAYQVWDSTSDPASGHWVVGGVAQAAGIAIDVSPAQLTSTSFQSGSGSDDLWVRANDGFMGGLERIPRHRTDRPDPVASASDVIATHGQDIAASILFSVSDADHDTITAYQVWDSTSDPASGHWVVGGVAQAAGIAIDVSPAQLTSTSFQSGSGSDDLWVRANDGITWGAWKEFHVTAPIDQTPVVAATDFYATASTRAWPQPACSRLPTPTGTASTNINSGIQHRSASSGHWSIGGIAQPASTAISVSPAQLAGTTFQGGTSNDDLWVRASDGMMWSAWQEFHFII